MARVDDVGVIAAPGLLAARDRLVLLSFMQGMATTGAPGTDIVVVVLSIRQIRPSRVGIIATSRVKA